MAWKSQISCHGRPFFAHFGFASLCFRVKLQLPDKLLFQVDLAPGETRTYYILDASALAAVPPPIVKTFARYVPERYDDFAWESDRIAHRTYGLALIPAEGTISSGAGCLDQKEPRPHRGQDVCHQALPRGQRRVHGRLPRRQKPRLRRPGHLGRQETFTSPAITATGSSSPPARSARNLN